MIRKVFINLCFFLLANVGPGQAGIPVNNQSTGPGRPVESFSEFPPGSVPIIMQALQKDLPAAYHLQRDNNTFSMSNPSQGMRITFAPEGPHIETDEYTWSLTMSGLGYEGSVSSVAQARLVEDEGRMVYKRGNVEEWYINSGWGIEQGFTIHSRPAGKGLENLVVEMQINGELQPSLGGKTLYLANVSGTVLSQYSDLQVFDAENNILPARFTLANNTLRILVDDSGAQYPITIDPWIQAAKLLPDDGEASDHFGDSVSISGDTIVVGAPGANAAYVFVKPAGGWMNLVQTAKLTASDGTSDDYFGMAVSISGDTIVVGASYNDGNGENAGAAYVFEKPVSGWTNMTETAKLTASDGQAWHLFGNSVAVSGSTIVVGAVFEGIRSSNTGAAYVFEKPGTGWLDMTETAKLTAGDKANYDEFGNAVAISGNTIVIGAHSDDDAGEGTGSAYVFEKPAAGWNDMTQTVKLTASDGAAGDAFGSSVSISGDTIVVGAPGDDDNGSDSGSAYVFGKPVTGWTSMTQTAKLTASDGKGLDRFGSSVSIAGETVVVGISLGLRICLGGPCEISPGASYIYEQPGSFWPDMTETGKVTSYAGQVNDGFGSPVSISGNTIVIGAQMDTPEVAYAGAAYVFEKSATELPGFPCLDQSSLLLEECNFLYNLYVQTNGPGWEDDTNWLTANDPCTWSGVTCEVSQYCTPTLPPVCSDIHRITEIRLPNNLLAGTIPDSIGNLQKLRFFNLRTNRVSGAIPTSVGNLISLTNMYLDNNALTGLIPPQMGSLTDLAYLDLSDNKLSGAIPSQIGSLSNLLFLDLGNNQLDNAIPTELGNLTGINLLNLSQNQLSGSIPTSFENLASPTLSIDLSDNLLTNTVPLSVAQVGADASYCNFSGNTLCIPNTFDYQSIGKNPICGLQLSDACVTAICSDNTVTAPEECDDGNLINGDGCSASCLNETGWYCSGSPSACYPTCGDGVVAGSEECDDGNTTGGDGCSFTCTMETGWTCSGSFSSCSTICSDGIVIEPEACDDGNDRDGDGCSQTCTIETKWICSGEPSVCERLFYWPMFYPAINSKVLTTK